MFYFDPLYFVFALPALLLAFYAQIKVKGAYNKYTQVRNLRGLTGLDAARAILRPEGLSDVTVKGVPGTLTDHYNPQDRSLGLSQSVAQQPSVASLAIVAHEIGHALQDHTAYAPLKLRGAIVPAVQVSPWIAYGLFALGAFMNSSALLGLGILVFSATVIFALVTLPVEFDASRRGLHLLQTYQLVDGRELQGAKAVLDAAALTYVAALAQSVATLLYYVFRFSSIGRRRD
jgi:Zn-dependent membrane protease YugP